MKRMLISFWRVITLKTQVKIRRKEQLSKMCSGSVVEGKVYSMLMCNGEFPGLIAR